MKKELPVVVAITCTKGRHTLLERCVGMLLKQDYEGELIHLIFNNSSVKQTLVTSETKRKIILVNQDRDSWTNELYTSIDRIFRDALSHVPGEATLITFFDDDDIFLDNHISEGVRGYLKGKEQGKISYKPLYSLMDSPNGREKIRNICEPSIFVEKQHLLKYGFSTHSAAYHLQWIEPLLRDNLLYEPEDGISTFVYQWVGGVFHVSGDGDNPKNLENHSKFSKDEGDRIITPKF